MPIPFFEPKSPRYIYVNPLTNKVHLLVPVVGGQEISTDNTCKSTVALDEFFGGAAEQELQSYRAALENDLELLPEGDTPLRRGKEERLAQIKSYIEVVEEMRHKKGSMIIQPLMEKTTNLHSIQLRPSVQDPASRVINPVFTVDRSNDEFGNPNSKLYNAMQLKYPSVISVIPDPMARLKKAVLDGLPEGKPDFELIQQRLKVQCMQLFDLDVDFTKTNIRKARVSDFEMTLTKESLGRFMGFQEDTTSNEDYIDALIGACAAEIGPTIQTPPFYSVPEHSDKAEKLSIMTQFFLAQVNIYCVTRGLSTANFGAVLDVSEDLSNQVADIVKSSLGEGADVENKLCEFFNRNKVSFGLTRDLESADVELIRQKFERTYRTVTATKENPHMDDFMVLDVTPGGSFFTHKGSICTDFANLVGDEAKYKYFADIRADFQTLVDGVAERNDWVQGSYEIDTSMIKDKKLAEWPSEIHKQVFDLYLIALKRDDAEMLAAILEVADNDPNILFEQSPDGGLPFIGLAEKPKLFETVVKKIDIGKLDQENLSRYYLVALFYKNPDLCAKISSKIEDKSTLFHSPDIDANPFELLLERKDIFIKLVSTVTIADLNPETLKRVYQLSLEHEATEICSECVKQLVAKPQQYDVLEYYLLALYAEKGDLGVEISKLIKDKSALFLSHSGIGIDPHQILATDSETFTNLVKSINIAELNPAALKEVCRLALAHNKQELYLQCIEQVKENPQQYNIVEYYVLSLVYKKTDLTIAISELIKDKNQLFVKGPGLKDDPFALLAKDKDAFDALSKKINIADLNPAALKQVYNLALMHNNQELYAKCIDQFKGDAHFIQSIDDLTFCCDNNYVESFKRVFELKQPSKDSCKELFVKALYAEKYEIAAAVLDKFPGIINEKIVTIGDGVPTYPLWVAIHTDNRKRCEFLLEHDANPYVTRPNLNTTLMREALGRPNLLAPFKTHNDAFAAMRMVFPELKKVLEDYPWKLKKTWYQAVDSSKTILLGTQRVPMELESLLSLINAVNSKGSITELKKHMQEVFGAIDNVPVKVMPERLKGDLKKMLSSACPDLQQDLAPPADMVAVTGRFKREVVGGRAEVPLLVEEQQHIHP